MRHTHTQIDTEKKTSSDGLSKAQLQKPSFGYAAVERQAMAVAARIVPKKLVLGARFSMACRDQGWPRLQPLQSSWFEDCLVCHEGLWRHECRLIAKRVSCHFLEDRAVSCGLSQAIPDRSWLVRHESSFAHRMAVVQDDDSKSGSWVIFNGRLVSRLQLIRVS